MSDIEQRYRLLCTILEPEQAPGVEPSVLYHERWEIENALDELKVHQRGPQHLHPAWIFPLTITAAHEHAITEILAERLGPRRLRINPRVIKRKMSHWPVKRPEHRNPPNRPSQPAPPQPS